MRREPHITIKQPFPSTSLDPFVTYIDELAAGLSSFEIVTAGIGLFEDGTVFLDVIQDRRLDALRRRIHRDLAAVGVQPAPVEDGRYHFHATLAQGSAEQAARARSALSGVPTEFRFAFDTLGLVCSLDADEWIVYHRARVGPGGG